MALKMLLVCLASWLILANSATVAPKGDGGEEPPPPPSELILQHEIQFEGKFPLQEQLSDDFTGLDLPFLDHGDPNSQTSAPFSPRGIRPSCHGGLLCTRQLPRFTLDEFPPARPTLSNIGNICAEGRKKSSYGRWNLPQTSFSHLSRQGDALNNLEEGFSQCCRLPGNEKLSCSNMVWLDVLEHFCSIEFSIKTRHYHCCKLKGARKERCFNDEAAFPNYDFKAVDDQDLLERKPRIEPLLPSVSFPPGEPTDANIKNICKLRRFRPTYPANTLPKSYFSWFVRQARTINRMENEFKKCCRKEDVGCAHKGWEKALTQYCKQEFSVKDRHHHCCIAETSGADYGCFARQAPFPMFDKEISLVSLAEITPALLDSLCGQFTLLTKQRRIPALVQNITELCCKMQGSERTQCAEEAKSQFITALCGTQRNTWKDPKKCCSQTEELARNNCFNANYLASVPLASMPLASTAPPLLPTELAV